MLLGNNIMPFRLIKDSNTKFIKLINKNIDFLIAYSKDFITIKFNF